MKRTILMMAGLLGLASRVAAQQIDGVSVENLSMARNGEYMAVNMEVELAALEVESNRAVLLTPTIVGEADSLTLPSIGIYGRTRYFHYLRNRGAGMLSGEDETSFRASRRPEEVAYGVVVPYAAWMNGAQLRFDRRDYGCCSTLLDEQSCLLGGWWEPTPWEPVLAYVRPEAAGEKSYSLSGSAFIDFPVNRTVIRPDYRRNAVELAKIQATIDSVRNDRDITITSVWLKGFASPESPYSHNASLAKGRTEALKSHIGRLYRFDEGIIQTDYEPEDWAGLRRYVAESNLEHREEILALIDSSLEPDAKEWKIRRSYPEEYRFLLQYCYPALRHTDYRISYVVRRFSDVEEIKRIMKTQPQKLGLEEFYLAAQTYEPGTPEFNEVFQTAVRMYPDDPVANLNAANTALASGDPELAARYLELAGDLPEADYARGAHALLREEYEQAERYMLRARERGVALAEQALEWIREARARRDRYNHK